MLTLRQWRKAKDKTLQSMANALNVHVNTYVKWEENPKKITIEYAYKIAEVLELNVEDIDFLCPGTPQKCGEE